MGSSDVIEALVNLVDPVYAEASDRLVVRSHDVVLAVEPTDVDDLDNVLFIPVATFAVSGDRISFSSHYTYQTAQGWLETPTIDYPPSNT